jgi:hypothetical protein
MFILSQQSRGALARTAHPETFPPSTITIAALVEQHFQYLQEGLEHGGPGDAGLLPGDLPRLQPLPDAVLLVAIRVLPVTTPPGQKG